MIDQVYHEHTPGIDLECGPNMLEHVFINLRKTGKSEVDKGCTFEKCIWLGMHKLVLCTFQLFESPLSLLFFYSITKPNDQSTLYNKAFSYACGFMGLESLMEEQSPRSRNNWELILIHKRQRDLPENDGRPHNPPQDILPPTPSYLLILPK